MGWRCGLVSHSEQGYERFEEADIKVIDWLNTELQEQLNSDDDITLGSHCYHLKGRGGIKKAIQDLQEIISHKPHPHPHRYRYIVRSDAKGYYAHIRHHKLIGLLNDAGFSRTVCHVTTQLCQRMTVHRGIYTERTQGIPLGCAASPALAAIYLSPLDNAIRSIPGVKYLRYMDDWVILCPTKWKMRRAVKVMHQTLHTLGLHVHPDKTFIGKTERGFDFLGAQFSSSPQSQLTLSSVSLCRLNEHLKKKFSTATRLYEQGKLQSLKFIELYLTHWLRWAKGIGIASSSALEAIKRTLLRMTHINDDDVLMITTFTQAMVAWIEKQIKQINNKNEIINSQENQLLVGHASNGNRHIISPNSSS